MAAARVVARVAVERVAAVMVGVAMAAAEARRR